MVAQIELVDCVTQHHVTTGLEDLRIEVMFCTYLHVKLPNLLANQIVINLQISKDFRIETTFRPYFRVLYVMSWGIRLSLD